MNKANAQFVVDPKGKKTAAILPIERYEQMVEDLHDLAVVADRQKEPAISAQEMKRRLKKHGVI